MDIEEMIMIPILLIWLIVWVAAIVFIGKIGLSIILWVWNLPL